MVNCINESHLNTVLDEAHASAKHHHGAAFFRQVAGGDRSRNGNPDDAGAGVVWNGKWTASSTQPCGAFNAGGEHGKSALFRDGTCKFCHKCDHWVSNKGKDGKCLNSAGSPGHSRLECDNPHKCDSAAKQ